MTGYRWYAGDLRTGRIYTEVPVKDSTPSWQIGLDGAGSSLSCSAYLGDPAVQALNLRSATAVAKTFLAVAYVDAGGNETILEAGPTWTRAYDDDKGILTIGAAGLWSYFDHRKLLPAITDNVALLDSTWTGLSLGTIAKRIVQQTQTHTGGNVPVVLPADIVAPSDDAHTRDYPGYTLAWVGDALRDLTQVSNGPEIAFRPRRQAADNRFIEWVMLTGTEVDPFLHQTGSFWIWDQSAPKSPVSKVNVAEDGTGIGSEAYVAGNGGGQSPLIGYAIDPTLTDLGYPSLELDVDGHTDETVQNRLNAYAAVGVLNGERSLETLTMTVDRDAFPQPSLYAVGDEAALVIGPNHWYLPAGNVVSRITQISGDDSNQVDLQLQPIPGDL